MAIWWLVWDRGREGKGSDVEEREEFRVGKEREGKTRRRGEGMCGEKVCSECEDGEDSGENGYKTRR